VAFYSLSPSDGERAGERGTLPRLLTLRIVSGQSGSVLLRRGQFCAFFGFVLAKKLRTEASGSVLHFFQGGVFGAKKVRTDPDADPARTPPFPTPSRSPRAKKVRTDPAPVIMHNHQSGEPQPSEADINLTRDVIRAGRM